MMYGPLHFYERFLARFLFMMTQRVQDILLMMLQSICVLYYCDVTLFLKSSICDLGC
jgi:hypothetical protein